jgi:DNA-binding NarL/FixJ family response regulator
MTNKLNILLVDDSEIIISNLETILADLDNVHSIENARSVAFAKYVLKEEETDIAILDISLPDGNGLELLKWAKKLFPKLTVIIFSNNADEVHRSIATEYGADYFFDKSTQAEELVQTVSVLESKCNFSL